MKFGELNDIIKKSAWRRGRWSGILPYSDTVTVKMLRVIRFTLLSENDHHLSTVIVSLEESFNVGNLLPSEKMQIRKTGKL